MRGLLSFSLCHIQSYLNSLILLKGKKEDDANLGRQFRELADNLNLTEDEVYRRITRGKEEQQDKPTEEKLAAMSTEELNKFIDNFNKNPRDTISKLAKEQAQEIVKQQTELQKAQKEFADAMITYPQIDKKSDSYDIEFHKAMDTLLKSTNYRMPVNEACNYVRLQFSEKSLNEQTAANQAQTDAQKKRAQTLSASGSGKSTPSRKPKSWDDAFAKAKEAIARGEY